MKNYTVFKAIKAAAAVTITAVFVLLAVSCGAPALSAPSDITVIDEDPDNPNRIELNWLPVEGADIYYVYRSTAEDGTFDYAGLSVTAADVEDSDRNTELRYSFIETFEDGEGGTYWYKVSAASNIDTSAESALSPAVDASTYEGTWGEAHALGQPDSLSLQRIFQPFTRFLRQIQLQLKSMLKNTLKIRTVNRMPPR